MLFAAERWQTYAADPELTYRALTAPGATTLLANFKGVVAGLGQLQSGWRANGVIGMVEPNSPLFRNRCCPKSARGLNPTPPAD